MRLPERLQEYYDLASLWPTSKVIDRVLHLRRVKFLLDEPYQKNMDLLIGMLLDVLETRDVTGDSRSSALVHDLRQAPPPLE